MPNTYLVQCAACGTEQRIHHEETAAAARCGGCGAPVIRSHCLPIPVTDAEWEAEMGGCTAPAMVVVWGENCSACAGYEPSVRLMAANLYGEARVLRLDIDHSPVTATRYGVHGVPTVLLFRQGALLASLTGPQGERGLREKLGLG